MHDKILTMMFFPTHYMGFSGPITINKSQVSIIIFNFSPKPKLEYSASYTTFFLLQVLSKNK